MQLSSIRADLAAVAEPFGWTSYPFIPADPSTPAVCVGLPSIEYGASLRRSKVEIPVEVLVSLADVESAQSLLDAALSTSADSLVDAFNDATSTSWIACRVVSAGEGRQVSIGSSLYLALTIRLELIA